MTLKQSELRDEVEHKILDGICEECDFDPTQCYNQGYCEYEERNESNGN